MLVSETVSTLIAWGIGIVVLVVGIAVGGGLGEKHSRLATLIGVGGLILAPIAVFGNWTRGTPVLVVGVSEVGGATRKDLRLYGSATYRFMDGHSARLPSGARALVVNDTPVPLSVRQVRYGASDQPDPTPIGGFQVVRVGGRIDHFGPDDRPPPRSKKWDRYWLQW